MHNTLIFYAQVPVAYISSFILTFFKHLYVWRFLSFSGLFQGTFWSFLHNRVATLITIGEQKISPKSDFLKEFLPTPITQDQNPSDFDYAGLVVVAVFNISSKYIGITRSLATRRTLGIPKLLKYIHKAQPEPEPCYEKAQLRTWSHFIFTRAPQPWLC